MESLDTSESHSNGGKQALKGQRESREYSVYSSLLLKTLNIVIQELYTDEMKFDTGQTLWESSIILGKWLARNPSNVQGKKVLELGAGCGFSGIIAAKTTHPSELVLTDYDEYALSNLKENLQLNGVEESSPTPKAPKSSRGPKSPGQAKSPRRKSEFSFSWPKMETKSSEACDEIANNLLSAFQQNGLITECLPLGHQYVAGPRINTGFRSSSDDESLEGFGMADSDFNEHAERSLGAPSDKITTKLPSICLQKPARPLKGKDMGKDASKKGKKKKKKQTPKNSRNFVKKLSALFYSKSEENTEIDIGDSSSFSFFDSQNKARKEEMKPSSSHPGRVVPSAMVPRKPSTCRMSKDANMNSCPAPALSRRPVRWHDTKRDPSASALSKLPQALFPREDSDSDNQTNPSPALNFTNPMKMDPTSVDDNNVENHSPSHSLENTVNNEKTDALPDEVEEKVAENSPGLSAEEMANFLEDEEDKVDDELDGRMDLAALAAMFDDSGDEEEEEDDAVPRIDFADLVNQTGAEDDGDELFTEWPDSGRGHSKQHPVMNEKVQKRLGKIGMEASKSAVTNSKPAEVQHSAMVKGDSDAKNNPESKTPVVKKDASSPKAEQRKMPDKSFVLPAIRCSKSDISISSEPFLYQKKRSPSPYVPLPSSRSLPADVRKSTARRSSSQKKLEPLNLSQEKAYNQGRRFKSIERQLSDDTFPNIGKAQLECAPSVRKYDWNTKPPDLQGYFDVIVGADLCYSTKLSPALADTISYSLNCNGKVVLITPTNRPGIPMFLERMHDHGFVHSVEKVDEYFLENPLSNSSQEEYRAHFYRFFTEVFIMYSFSFKKKSSA